MLRVLFRIGLLGLMLFFLFGLVVIKMDGCSKPAEKSPETTEQAAPAEAGAD